MIITSTHHWLAEQVLVFGWAFLIPLAISAISAIAANKQKNREAQNAQTAMNNQAAGDDYRTQQNALTNLLLGQSNETARNANIDLDRRQFALQAPGIRGQQALAGSLLANLKPATMTGGSPQMQARMPQISGGLTPDAISPQARQMGELLQLVALSGQKAGDKFDPLATTNWAAGLLAPPGRDPLKEPSRTESLLGLIGGIGGAAWNAYQAQPAAAPSTAYTGPAWGGGFQAGINAGQPLYGGNPSAGSASNPYRNVALG